MNTADSSPPAVIRHSKSAVEVGGSSGNGAVGGVVVIDPTDAAAGLQSGVLFTKGDAVSGDTLSLASSTSTKKIHHSVSFSFKTTIGDGGGGREEDGGDDDAGDALTIVDGPGMTASNLEVDSHVGAANSRLSPSSAGDHSATSAVSDVTAASSSSLARPASSSGVAARSPSVTVANFIHCKLCLCDYPPREMVQLANCRCLFCADCLTA